MTTKTIRRKHTEDFKREAVALVTEQGYGISQAARSLGINPNLIHKWKQQQSEQASGVRLGKDERDGKAGVRYPECIQEQRPPLSVVSSAPNWYTSLVHKPPGTA